MLSEAKKAKSKDSKKDSQEELTEASAAGIIQQFIETAKKKDK